MFPFRTSSIFRSRWMALLWSAGILWFAYDVATDAAASSDGNNSAGISDASGAQVTPEQVEAARKALDAL
jgi:hypothetical protein